MVIMFTDFVIISHPHSLTWNSLAFCHLQTRYWFQFGMELEGYNLCFYHIGEDENHAKLLTMIQDGI